MIPPPQACFNPSPSWRCDHFVAHGGTKRMRRRPLALMGAPWSPCRGDHNPYSKLPLRCPIRLAPGAPSCPSRGWTSARYRLAFVELYFFISPPARHEIAPPARGVWGTSEEAVSADCEARARGAYGSLGDLARPILEITTWNCNTLRARGIMCGDNELALGRETSVTTATPVADGQVIRVVKTVLIRMS